MTKRGSIAANASLGRLLQAYKKAGMNIIMAGALGKPDS